MKINMNKDFETAFQSTAFKGFTWKEILTAGIALIAMGGIAAAVWYVTRLPIDVCVYFGIPVMIPIIGVGMLRYQGISMWGLMKEMWYMYRTRELPYEAEECSENGLPVFTMKKNTIPKKKKYRKKGGR